MTAETLAGIVPGLPEVEYHAHPALSSTNARRILESPARFRYLQQVGEKPKAAFDIGTAAHSKVLGTGVPVAVIPADLLASNGAVSTKAAKEFVEQARAEGKVPIKQDVADQVDAMAEAVLSHPTARALLERDGTAEASVFSTDPDTAIDLRARFDFLPTLDDRQVVAVDLKSIGTTASPADFAKNVAAHGYDVQRGHYLDTLQFATGDIDAEMVFVVVESEPPHLVGVYQLDRDFREMGQAKAKRAREVYRRCLDTNEWPGYPTEISLLQPPVWAIYQYQEQYA